MPRVSLWFFAVAVIYAICGMLWGMHMGETGDHSMLPAHAHWNLLGWVGMSIYGAFYALARDTVPPKFAWATFILANLGMVVLIPFLVIFIQGGEDMNSPYIPELIVGEVLTLLGMISFAVSVWMALLKNRK